MCENCKLAEFEKNYMQKCLDFLGEMCIILVGSARRGASGALHLQSTTVELNAHLRGEFVLQVG